MRKTTLGIFTALFVPFGLMLVAANIWAEIAPFPAHVRTATTIWIAMLFAVLAIVLCLAARSDRSKGAVALAWSFGLAAMLLHLFFAIGEMHGGSLRPFLERNGLALTLVNLALVAWWAFDVALLWLGRAARWVGWQRNALIAVLLAFFVYSSVVLKAGFVRWLGIALAAAVAVAVVLRWAARRRS